MRNSQIFAALFCEQKSVQHRNSVQGWHTRQRLSFFVCSSLLLSVLVSSCQFLYVHVCSCLFLSSVSPFSSSLLSFQPASGNIALRQGGCMNEPKDPPWLFMSFLVCYCLLLSVHVCSCLFLSSVSPLSSSLLSSQPASA